MNWHCTDIFRRTLALAVVGFTLVGCGNQSRIEPPAASPIVQPQDFALVPCDTKESGSGCVLVVAGGKRILLGAPAGLSHGLSQTDLRGLDLVALFSLRAADIEGLDEVRNASWRAGRTEPLTVFGPSGTSSVSAAINQAFEQADALRIVDEGIPPGGYDAAVLEALDASRRGSQMVYDTGDLKIEARVLANGFLSYLVTYDLTVGIVPCGRSVSPGGQSAIDENIETVDRQLNCGGNDLNWPLSDIVFLKSEG